MSTEKDREAAKKYDDTIDDERFDNTPPTELVQDAFLAGIQHARQEQKPLLIKFVTWIRNHYAVNAVATNKDLVEYFLGEK